MKNNENIELTNFRIKQLFSSIRDILGWEYKTIIENVQMVDAAIRSYRSRYKDVFTLYDKINKKITKWQLDEINGVIFALNLHDQQEGETYEEFQERIEIKFALFDYILMNTILEMVKLYAVNTAWFSSDIFSIYNKQTFFKNNEWYNSMTTISSELRWKSIVLYDGDDADNVWERYAQEYINTMLFSLNNRPKEWWFINFVVLWKGQDGLLDWLKVIYI